MVCCVETRYLPDQFGVTSMVLVSALLESRPDNTMALPVKSTVEVAFTERGCDGIYFTLDAFVEVQLI